MRFVYEKHAEEEVGGGGGENKARSANGKPEVRLSNVGQPMGFELVREALYGHRRDAF